MKSALLFVAMLYQGVAPAVGVQLLSYREEQPAQTKSDWTWVDSSGRTRTLDDLAQIFREHKKWLDTKKAEGTRADLTGARLLHFDIVALFPSHREWVDSRGFKGEKLSLQGANLKGTDFRGANLLGLDLREADLQDADFRNTVLSWVELHGAHVHNTDFSWSCFNPQSVPRAVGMAEAKGFSRMFFPQPESLITLRNSFREAGFRKQERELTFALKRVQDRWTIDGMFRFVFFEFTCNWGMSPWRPLFILVGLIPFFAILYAIALLRPKKPAGIWKTWPSDCISAPDKRGEIEFQRHASWVRTFDIAVGFSCLSAFHIGWRDLNVGNWLMRVVPWDFTLRATGWAKSVSGIQSLISVYLIALWVLTYFGRPFD